MYGDKNIICHSTSQKNDTTFSFNLKGTVLQITQLLIANGALILLPSKLFFRQIIMQHWCLYSLYVLFFFGGTLTRILRFGKLAPRSQDKQVRKFVNKAAFVLFIFMIPALHWIAMYHSSIQLNIKSNNIVSFVCYSFMVLAMIINWSAAWLLGRAYDRVVTPDQLVMSGPYGLCRHPIYLSYMMLFSSYCTLVGSWQIGALILFVCIVYYQQRTSLEEGLLELEFGDEYLQYQRSVKKYLPFVVCFYFQRVVYTQKLVELWKIQSFVKKLEW
eukprot:TRINITY_DN60556_c0_g1_i3.p1 TRINITY_DN60556_c0_g1~~TRINITY_DN60556_c0_g1_i3.p1  ORF type:complete len:273 (-),score=1.99 TRINITY_DN60556_c0_g1_i3:58-876(-)